MISLGCSLIGSASSEASRSAHGLSSVVIRVALHSTVASTPPSSTNSISAGRSATRSRSRLNSRSGPRIVMRPGAPPAASRLIALTSSTAAYRATSFTRNGARMRATAAPTLASTSANPARSVVSSWAYSLSWNSSRSITARSCISARSAASSSSASARPSARPSSSPRARASSIFSAISSALAVVAGEELLAPGRLDRRRPAFKQRARTLGRLGLRRPDRLEVRSKAGGLRGSSDCRLCRLRGRNGETSRRGDALSPAAVPIWSR